MFRSTEQTGHVFLQEPYRISLIACPGLYRPLLDKEGRLSGRDVAELERKLDLILKIAACHGHDAVVLGALGCGGE